jgi:hypothetical protein
MDNIFLLYLLTRLDALQGLFIGLTIVCGFVALMCIIIGNVEEIKGVVNWGRRAAFGAVISAICATLVPTQKDALFILAGIGVIEAAKTDTAKRIASKSVQVIEDFLDSQINKKKSKE